MFWAQKNYLGVGIVAVVALGLLVFCIKYREIIMNFIDKVQGKEE